MGILRCTETSGILWWPAIRGDPAVERGDPVVVFYLFRYSSDICIRILDLIEMPMLPADGVVAASQETRRLRTECESKLARGTTSEILWVSQAEMWVLDSRI